MKRACVVGLGLIGGSLALAFSHRQLFEEIIGVDVDPRAVRSAREAGAVTAAFSSLKEGVSGADIVFVCVPVKDIPRVVRELTPCIPPGAVITDVGSAKRAIVEEIESSLPQGVNYLGGHPMTGSEERGFNAADPYLFENAVYVVTPTPRTTSKAREVLREVITGLGAKVVEMSPEQHDAVVACVSHLPHLVAVALVNAVAGLGPWLDLAAGGFRDTTRVASGDAGLWADIILHNREMVLSALREFRYRLADLESAVEASDGARLEELILAASNVRATIPARKKGLLPPLHEIVVTVPDRPGVIGRLGMLLGDRGINIIDIEILKVREGEGGTIRMGFVREEDASRALAVLAAGGIRCRRR